MKQTFSQTLRLLGLTEEESIIYQSLCDHDMLTLAHVARVTGLHRPRLYKLLPDLVQREVLEEHLVGKRTHYRATPPADLIALWQAQTTSVSDDLATLQENFETTRRKPTMQFYTGMGGNTKLFDDIAESVGGEGTVFRYSARVTTEQAFHNSTAYKKKRDAGKIDRMIITSATEAAQKFSKKRLDRSVRTIPDKFDPFDDNVSQLIFGDKVAFIDHEADASFVIHSKKIAGLQKKLFRLLWRHLKEG